MKQLTGIFFLITLIISCNTRNDKKDITKKEDAAVSSATSNTKKTIVFFGNSLTAGYGLNPDEAFPALIQDRIDSLNLPYTIVNAGVSGETTSGGKSRIGWILKQKVDIFILELGANDGLRGIPVTESKKNLQVIIDSVKIRYPEAKIILAGMQLPPSMGQTYATEFREIYPALASQNNIALIPFILEGVGGEIALNQQDGIHPTAEGHRILAENVWVVLKDFIL